MTEFTPQEEPAAVYLHEGRLYVDFARFNGKVDWEALRRQLQAIGLELAVFMDEFAQAMAKLTEHYRMVTIDARQCGKSLREASMMVASIRKLDRVAPNQPDWARHNQAPRSYRRRK